MWTVGGLAPNATAVDDGLGRLVQSGTNARFVPSRLVRSQSKSREEIEKHESRLATALKIDQASKIFGFDQIPFPIPNVKSWRQEKCDLLQRQKTAWNGTEWVNDKLTPRRYFSFLAGTND